MQHEALNTLVLATSDGLLKIEGNVFLDFMTDKTVIKYLFLFVLISFTLIDFTLEHCFVELCS